MGLHLGIAGCMVRSMQDAICFLCDAFAFIIAEPDRGNRLHVRCPNCREYGVVTSWLQKPKEHAVKKDLIELSKGAPNGMMLLIDTEPKVVERAVALSS